MQSESQSKVVFPHIADEVLDAHFQLTQHNVFLALRDKILQRISRDDDIFRQFHHIFGIALKGEENSGLDKRGLRRLIVSLGIPVAQGECELVRICFLASHKVTNFRI